MKINLDEISLLDEQSNKEDHLDAVLGIAQAIVGGKQDISSEIKELSSAIANIEIPKDKTKELFSLVSSINDKSFAQSDKQLKILVESIKTIILEVRKSNEEIVEKLSIIGNAEEAIQQLNKNLELDRSAEWDFLLTRKNGELEKVRAIRTS
tara:strand:+ start:2953 stop:3408 length:456 start_codon:yes stop_codon:yes gene_type:complete